MSQGTVIIGFAEALSAPEVAWSLLDAGFQVKAVARKGRRSALHHSRYVSCHDICAPESDLSQAVADMRGVLASEANSDRNAPKLLFPLDDTAVWMCNELQLGDEWTLLGPRQATAEIALNKRLQTQLAEASGFRVPRTVVANTRAEVLAFAGEMDSAVILKPVECVPIREGRKIACRKWICANSAELQRALDQWAERVPLLVQNYVVGVGEGIFGLAAPDGIRAWSAHRRVRMMNPQGSGSSACMSVVPEEELKNKVETLITKAQWKGLFMIELLRDHEGTVWFVELNGRPWGSIALARRQGLEYPAWSAQLALDPASPAGRQTTLSPGLLCRNMGREFMHLLFVLRGPRSTALVEWPSLWESLAGVLRMDSSDRYYNWRKDDSQVFLADCYYTVQQNLFKARN